jgi:lipopolysaccharide export system permease protein
VSLLLIVNILVLIPTAKQLNANFIDYKRAEAKFNIKATEFGQKFSDWLVFIDKSDQTDSYSGIVLYQENTITNKQKIITSLGADIENINGKLRLNLNTGKAFEISIDKIEQVDFAKMYIKADPKDHISEVKDIYSYWIEALHDDKREKDLAFFLLIALFPLATVLFAISFGIVTYRYEKSKINFMIAVVILGYMVPGVLLVEHIGLGAVLVTVSISAITSYLYYRKKIILRY